MGVKGGMLKDSADWSKLGIKEGHTFMLMGSAVNKVAKKPKVAVVFAEDLPQDQLGLVTATVPGGYRNLGNTCYMNATLECLRFVDPLRKALSQYNVPNPQQATPSEQLVLAMKDLYALSEQSANPTPPMVMIRKLRDMFPQFAQTSPQGGYMQQDAEECWTGITSVLSRELPESIYPKSIFGGELSVTMTCDEAPEEVSTRIESFDKLTCNITKETNFLYQSLRAGMNGTLVKHSSKLNRDATFTKKSCIASLPEYLTLQFVRFYWRRSTQQKTKMVRPVEFPLLLDMYEYCTEELQTRMTQARRVASEAKGANESETSSEMSEDATLGKYELMAVLTHQGRDADGGHYCAYVRDKKDPQKWLFFDDDTVTWVSPEDVKKLDGKGGGDWHMSYINLYRRKEKEDKMDVDVV